MSFFDSLDEPCHALLNSFHSFGRACSYGPFSSLYFAHFELLHDLNCKQ